jgi:hypothetical protein
MADGLVELGRITGGQRYLCAHLAKGLGHLQAQPPATRR